jgi:Tfp pilus assembly protein PilF
VKKSPDNLRPKIALALVKVTENDLVSAEELLRATAILAPSSDDVVIALGHLEAGMGRTAEAAAMFQKAIRIDANNTDAWISLGSLQLEAGDTKAAEQSFKRAAESPKTQAPLAYVVFLIRQNRRAEFRWRSGPSLGYPDTPASDRMSCLRSRLAQSIH